MTLEDSSFNILKNNTLGSCPAKRLSYAVLADGIRRIFNPYLEMGHRDDKAQDIEWLFSDSYGRKVDKAGGCSFDFCCLSLDVSHETFRAVVRALLDSKQLRDTYLHSLYNNLLVYNNIYYNIYINNK